MDGRQHTIRVADVAYVTDLKTNLHSVSGLRKKDLNILLMNHPDNSEEGIVPIVDKMYSTVMMEGVER